MLQRILKRPCPGPQCRLGNCNLGISLYAMTRRLRFKASTFTASDGAVGMDFGVRAVLVLWFCGQYPGFLAWVFLIRLTLILGGVLETFVPHWINLCRELVCFPMVVAVPKYLPPVFHFMSPASRVANRNSMVWLRTGVSSGNQPRFVIKSRKYHAHLEGPVGTEYLEDVALEQRGKVRGSWRSPGR